jgi:hypothetical protein
MMSVSTKFNKKLAGYTFLAVLSIQKVNKEWEISHADHKSPSTCWTIVHLYSNKWTQSEQSIDWP